MKKWLADGSKCIGYLVSECLISKLDESKAHNPNIGHKSEDMKLGKYCNQGDYQHSVVKN